MQLLAKFKQILYVEFRATLNFRKMFCLLPRIFEQKRDFSQSKPTSEYKTKEKKNEFKIFPDSCFLHIFCNRDLLKFMPSRCFMFL